MTELALLITALLFGGMVLYSFGFAAFLFTSLPADTASPLLRKAFPHFYLFVLSCSLIATGLAIGVDHLSAAILGAVFLTTVYARQILMPAINAATDDGNKSRFKKLHWFSVLITLSHIVAAAWCIVRLAHAA
ncbi:MAG: DUF4149 domain-containing protein [Pseudomonadota bacterium]